MIFEQNQKKIPEQKLGKNKIIGKKVLGVRYQ